MMIKDCSTRGVQVGPVILEDVVIDGLRTAQLLQVWGPALKHVAIRGRIGRLMISDLHDPSASPEDKRAFKAANAAYYKTVDWAIDISDAEFEEADFRGVPGELVRRDSRDQALVRRNDLLDGRWRSVDLTGTWFGTALELMLDRNWESYVLVAPRRDKAYGILVKAIGRLRDAGVAVSD